ncbi:helix-turn-helix transcriptional regulator [Saccharopolyspora halophila]|uniref:Helix-turn-helix transcriptional regulator n=1 Tax=Saccharopolyspora halophila TaxID=405551 RepID=A0ABN3FXM8_9PSEU
MTKQPGPNVRRRQLGATLSELRRQSGKTIKDAAGWLGMTESNVSKIEKARQTVKPPTLRALGQLYDLDAAKVDYLLRLANEANQRGWWTAYRDTVPDWFRQFVGLEADAEVIWEYQAELVPGLLQTPAYVRAIARAARPAAADEDLDKSVALRRERQERIDGEHPPKLRFFLNEAVIRRPVGRPEEWRHQLECLVEASRLPHVELRVLPFAAGQHAAMLGSFVMMRFPDEESPAFVYVEHDRGAIYQEDPGDIERYTVNVADLEQRSAGPEGTRAMLLEAVRAC